MCYSEISFSHINGYEEEICALDYVTPECRSDNMSATFERIGNIYKG